MSENIDRGPVKLSSYPRAIVHIDADAFFVSCEQARNPSLKGKPVVTGKERGIISCAGYEAKALGISRGVSLSDARVRCPGLIVLPSDYELYSIYSQRMLDITRSFTPDVEQFSIDEVFCDITGLRRLYHLSYPDIARRVKDTIRNELDITVSVGISLSKTLAKLCSEARKPDGCVALPGYGIQGFLKEVPIEMVCGFGPSKTALLKKLGVITALDYIERPLSFAEKMLGKCGSELWRELRGEAVYALTLGAKERYLSISKTKTFMPTSSEKDVVKGYLARMLESACIKLRRHSLAASTLTIYLRGKDFSHHTAEVRLARHSGSTLDFSAALGALFDSLFRRGMSYRATGVVLSNIAPKEIDARTLFDDPAVIKRIESLTIAIDKINVRHGKHKIHLAVSDAIGRKSQAHPRNIISWRQSHLLKGETARKRLYIPLLNLNARVV